MSTRVNVNRYLVEKVTVSAHPDLPDLITASIVERAGGHVIENDLVMAAEFWKQVIDQVVPLLAAVAAASDAETTGQVA